MVMNKCMKIIEIRDVLSEKKWSFFISKLSSRNLIYYNLFLISTYKIKMQAF